MTSVTHSHLSFPVKGFLKLVNLGALPHPKGLKAHLVGSCMRYFIRIQSCSPLGPFLECKLQKLCPIPTNYHVKGKWGGGRRNYWKLGHWNRNLEIPNCLRGALSSFSETLGCCPLGGDERLRERTQLGAGPNPPYQQKLNLNYAINSLSSNFFSSINPWYSLIVLLPSLYFLAINIKSLGHEQKVSVALPSTHKLNAWKPQNTGQRNLLFLRSLLLFDTGHVTQGLLL